MKNFLLLFLILSIFHLSCSSDDSDTNIVGGNSGLIYSTEYIFQDNPVSGKVFYEYNTYGYVSKATNQFGESSSFIYENGKLISIDHGESSYEYLYTGDKITKIIYGESIINVTYNDFGFPTMFLNEEGKGYILEYFENGNIKMKHSLFNGEQTVYEYDNKINPYYEIYPRAYCLVELIGQNNVVKANNTPIQISYDGNYPFKIITADGITELITYN